MIYVPDKNYSCYVVRSENVIRAYEQTPKHNITTNYRDYYFNSNYLFQDGEQTFNQYSTLPVCLSNDLITDDFYYRNDFPDILVMFFIISFFVLFIPYKIFSRSLGRWLKL